MPLPKNWGNWLMKLKIKSIVALLLISLCWTAVVSYARITIPDRPYNHVVDLANIITSTVETNLNRYLLELEQKTTAQVVVLTINSLEGESIEDLSIEIAHNKWKLGQKDKDNGVLLLVSVQDRKYRFETGYGIEGILPDSLTGSIGRDYLVPYFKKGDYSTGIFTATLAVISKIASDAEVEIAGMPRLKSRSASPSGSMERRKLTLPEKILSLLFFIGLIYLFIKHPRLFFFFLMFSMMGGGRRSGWGGGGGFGGGSFGGGGGGGFGGGGASGGW